MNTRDDRDQSIDNLLRQSFQESSGTVAPGSSCLDAETLGAWAEGSLSENGLATVEAHLSDCARCQRIVAVLAKMPAAASESHQSWWRLWGMDLRWLVPLAAGATAVALWVAVPGRQAPQSVVSPPIQTPSAVEAKAAVPPEGRLQARADEREIKSEAAETPAQDQRDALRQKAPVALGDTVGRAPERPSAPPAASPAAAAPTAEAAAGARAEPFGSRQTNVIAQEVVSPTPLVRWRVGPRGLLQYSASGGAAWEQLITGVVVDLVAGSSPSSSVCWVVGRAGTVLLTIDGRRFDRIAFPANVDLTAVRATDARTAIVGSVDGRVFSTSDGGVTWTQ